MAVVRAAYKAIDAGDVDRFFADFAPDAVAYDAEGLPYGGVYGGRDGWMRLMKAMFGAWESATWDIQQMTAGGDLVIVYFQMTFKAKGAAPFKHPILELWAFAKRKSHRTTAVLLRHEADQPGAVRALSQVRKRISKKLRRYGAANGSTAEHIGCYGRPDAYDLLTGTPRHTGVRSARTIRWSESFERSDEERASSAHFRDGKSGIDAVARTSFEFNSGACSRRHLSAAGGGNSISENRKRAKDFGGQPSFSRSALRRWRGRFNLNSGSKNVGSKCWRAVASALAELSCWPMKSGAMTSAKMAGSRINTQEGWLMFDLAAELPRLLPKAIAWAEARAAEAAARGVPLSATGVRLARAVGVQQPDLIRVVEVASMPLPEDAELRFAAMRAGLLGPGMVGLTLAHGIFILRGFASNRLISHECRHVFQYEAAGSIAAFLPLYLQQIVVHGYEHAPFEIDATAHELDVV